MPTYPILYSFRRCPYAMRARLAIVQSGIQLELREVELKNKPQQMLTASPKGTVPVLVLEEGTVIDESLDIMLWALSQNDSSNWLNKFTNEQQQQMHALIINNDNKFKNALDKYKYADRFPGWPEEHYRQQGEVFLQMLESRLEKNTYLFAKTPSLADIAIFPFVRQFAFVNKNWFDNSPYKQLQAWLAGFINSELFTIAMEKTKPWQAGDDVILLKTET